MRTATRNDELRRHADTRPSPVAAVAELRRVLDSLAMAGEQARSFRGLPVQRHAFFPGGFGLVGGPDAVRFPVGGVLVLGSNWGHADSFIDDEGTLRHDDERGGPTWRPLLRSLANCGIDPDDCFFSNAFPVLHTGANGSNLNPHFGRWLRSPDLMRDCLAMLEATLQRIQPRLILALGKAPAAFVAARWPQHLGAWASFSLRGMDDRPWATVPGPDGGELVCCAITHPSNATANARLRRAPYTGRDGEQRLLCEAWRAAQTIRQPADAAA